MVLAPEGLVNRALDGLYDPSRGVRSGSNHPTSPNEEQAGSPV